jgi:hypothetical protein
MTVSSFAPFSFRWREKLLPRNGWRHKAGILAEIKAYQNHKETKMSLSQVDFYWKYSNFVLPFSIQRPIHIDSRLQ